MSDEELPAIWATTEEVMAAAKASKPTVFRWSRMGVLPPYEMIYARGRYARWPVQAPAQAAWVVERLEKGWTFREISAALARGEFKLA